MAYNLFPPHLWENEDRVMLDNEVISPKLKLQPGQDPYKEENYNVFTFSEKALSK